MGMTVEEYVLSMQFDNKDFERNVDKTSKSLSDLKNSLRMDGASRGLGEVSNSMKDLEYASYKTGFQWSDVVGKIASTAEWRIARHAIDSVTHGLTNLFKMLTGLSHIKSGLTEYETQINAIQTILANTENKGTTLDDVNEALDELNAYADKTIYNFTEMTKNIGRFTAAGVDLDTSVSAIKGIANLAAVSGSTSQQASTAMYQLSQALASGTVKLMDWNSVVNAGMGGELFQNALKETARVHGIAIDQIIESQGSFRESLSEGWITSEILSETLAKFTGDLSKEQLLSMGYTSQQADEILKLGETANDAATKVKTFTQLMDTLKEAVGSGWAQSWEIIIGDFEEAKTLWSGLSDFLSGIINKTSEIRNNMLTNVFDSGWSKMLSYGSIKNESGLTNWLNSLSYKNTFNDLVKEYGSVEKAIQVALSEELMTTDQVVQAVDEYTQQIVNATDAEKANLGYTEETVAALVDFNNKLQDTNGVIKYSNGELTTFGKLMRDLSRVSGRDLLLGPTVKDYWVDDAGNKIEYIRKEQTGALANLYNFVMSLLEPIKKAFREIFGDKQKEEYAEKIYNIIKAFQEWTASLELSEETSENLHRTFKGLFAAIDIVLTVLKAAGRVIGYVFEALGPVIDVILSITAALGDFLVWLREVINSSEPFKMVADGIGAALVWITTGIKDLVDQTKELDFTFLTEAFQQVKTVLSAIWVSIKTIFGQFWSTLYEKASTGEEITLQEILETLMNLAKTVLSGAIIKKLIDFFKALKGPKDACMDFLRSFREDLFGEIDEYKKKMLQIELLKTIAMAIGILVVSLLLLTTIPYDKLLWATGVLTHILGSLIGIFAAITGLFNVKKIDSYDKANAMNKTVKSLIPIVVSVLILAIALKKIASLDTDKMFYALIAINVLLGALIGCLWLLKVIDNQQDPKQLKKTVKSLTTISLSLLILAGVLKILSNIPWKELLISTAVMSTVLYELIGALAILSKVKFGEKAKGNVLKLLGIATVLLMMTGVLAILSTIEWKKMLTAVGAMSVVLYGFVGALAILGKIKFAEKAKGNTLRLIGISVALLAVAGVLAILSTIPWNKMYVAVKAMGLSLVALVGALAVISKVKINKKAEGNVLRLFVISTSLVLVASVLKILSTIPWDEMYVAIKAMALSLVALVGALAVISKIRFTKTATGVQQMIGIAAALLVMTVVIKQLASMSWDEMLRGIAGMAMTLTALVGALAVMALISKISKSGIGAVAVAASLILLAAAIKIMIPSIEELGTLPIRTIVQGLLAMVAGIAALGLVSALLSTCIPAMIGVAGAITMLGIAVLAAGAGVYVFAAGLDLLCRVIIQNGSLVITALVDIVKAFAELLPFLAVKLGEAIVALAGVITRGAPALAQSAVALILSVLDALTTVIPELARSLLEIILGLLQALNEYAAPIVDAVCTFIIKIIDAITARVPEITESLMNLFVAILQSFTEAMKQVDTSMLIEGILSLAEISLFLTLLAGLTPLVPLAMIGVLALGVLIAELALVLAAIGKITNSGLVSSIQNAAPLLGAIGTAIGQFIGGIIGGITAEASNALPVLADNLSSFMVKLQPFIDGLKQLDAGMVANALTLAGVIAIITATSIVNGINNFLSAIGLSGGGIESFADDLAAFGKGIKEFNDEVIDIDTNSLTAAANAGLALGKMAALLPTTGGLWDLLAGSNTCPNFGLYGLSLASFALAVSKIKNIDQMAKVAEAGITLGEMAKAMPTQGGLWDWLAGKNSCPDFGEFGESIAAFADKSSEIDTGAVDKGVTAGNKISDMLKNLPNSGGLWQFITGEVKLNKLSSNLTAFASSIVDFVDIVGKVENVSSVVDTVTALNTSLSDFSNSGINAFMTSFNETTPKVNGTVTEMLNAATNAIKNKAGEFKSTATDLMKKFVDGIKSRKDEVKKALGETVEESVNALRSKKYYNEFYNTGSYLSEGFASGVNGNKTSIISKIKTMASNVLQAARDALGVASPSKEFMTIGRYSSEGLALGLLNYANTAYDASEEVGNSAISGLSNAVAKISSMVENNIDAQPVIRPVLDLSNVESGAGAINGMFGMTPSVGVMSRVNSISSSMNKIQNGGNDDVISAIADLKHTIENTSGDTYNINGVTYDDGSALQSAIETIVRATIRERRR